MTGVVEAWKEHEKGNACCQYECSCNKPVEHEHDFDNEKKHFIAGWRAKEVLVDASVQKLREAIDNEEDVTAFNTWQIRKTRMLKIVDSVFGVEEKK